MIASQTVYLTLDNRAVGEGDKAAKFLLVRAGSEISQALAEKFDGAVALIGGTKPAPKSEGIETREPALENRDPKPAVPKATNLPPPGTSPTGGKHR